MKLNLRQIDEKDVDLLFNWSNDPVVRNQSFNSNVISYEEHVSWFNKKIASKNSMMYIFDVDKKSVGLVRFDQLEYETVIGVLVDANFRGFGLASQMLSKSVDEYIQMRRVNISAYIKNENQASIKSFKKAGFTFLKEEEVQGWPSVKYIFRPSIKNCKK